MSGLEVAAIALGTAVARAACGVWLADHRLVAAAGTGLIDQAAQRLTSVVERRRFRRLWEEAAELVAARIEPLMAHEFRGLPEYERLAAIDAVRATFDAVRLTEVDLFARDLDAGYLDRHLRSQDPDRATVAALSAAATSLYDLLLRECCAYTIEVVRTMPGAGIAGLTELLRRDRQLLDELRTVLERLPARRGVADFARDYRQLVANMLDHMELFGATLADTSRRYPLSVAYLSLTVSGDFTLCGPADLTARGSVEPRAILLGHGDGSTGRKSTVDFGISRLKEATAPATTRIEEVLAGTRRLLLRGEAGSGKTTLLQWIAVQCARGSLPDRLADWRDTVPFFVRLRHHAEGGLPAPEAFVSEVGRHIAAEMPPGWVHEQLRSGRAVVLVDGVDELTDARRGEVRRWLRELVSTFPAARYVVTTRPAAVPADWLGRHDFDLAELDPMTPADLPAFVHRWHEAMRELCQSDDERAELAGYEERLLDALYAHRHLRSLAQYPLLCALLCALHRDRRGQLPRNRMELYEVALHMLLERRDQERRLPPRVPLSRTDQTLLLRDLAYWLIRNDWASAPAPRVRERIAAKLTGMAHIETSADHVYRHLVERSGLLREPAEGHTDFVHRTFQDYLAAEEAVATDDIGALIANAWTDLWNDVVVMAAGHATPAQRTELIRGLLDRAADPGTRRGTRATASLRLLAVACLETSPELPPDLRREVQQATQAMLPPKTMTTARTVTRSAGGFALDLLARSEPCTASEVAATIRAVADIGDPSALPLLARFGTDPRKAVVRELLRAWPRFDPDEYARTVLPSYALNEHGFLEIQGLGLIPSLRHLGNLQNLNVIPPDGGVVDLAFVRDLPYLRRLLVPNVPDLHPLADSTINTFVQSTWRGAKDHDPLSLSPLAGLSCIEHLIIEDRRVTDLEVLDSLTHLDGLILYHLENCGQLAELSALRNLTRLGIGRLPDLRNLRPLRFLDRPEALHLQDCQALTDVGELASWAQTLSDLRIFNCPIDDLSPLGSLSKLNMLSLACTGEIDLAPVAAIQSLRHVHLVDRVLPDLSPLRSLPVLATVYLLSALEVDLEPFAGREGLEVTVGRTTRVHGADQLGPGSRIRRWPRA